MDATVTTPRPPERARARSVAKNAVLVVATVALVAILVRKLGGAGSVLEAARSARPGWVALAFAIACACVVLGALRWQVVVEAMGRRLSLWRALVAELAAWPLSAVTPSRAGDLARAWAVRDRVPLAEGIGSVLAEKVVDALVLLAIVAAGAAAARLWIWCVVAVAGLGAALALVLGLLRSRSRLERLPGLRGRAETIERLFLAFDALVRAPGRLAWLVVLSTVVRTLTLAVIHALFVALGADVSFFDTATLWPAAILVGLAPLTLGGMGTRDAAFLYLLGERGHLTQASILAATIAYWAVATGAFAIVGLPFMWLASSPRAAPSTGAESGEPGRAGAATPDGRGPAR